MVGGARAAITDDGALPAKVKTMMMMICDALLNHEGGVTNLANRARGMGASEEEIAEALGRRVPDGRAAGDRRGEQRIPQHPAVGSTLLDIVTRNP